MKIFLYYINKKVETHLFMNYPIICGVLVEVGIVIAWIYLIRKFQKRQTRQPALSRSIIKNLKF